MKTKLSMLDDPVVREVRQARAKLWKEGGGTIEGFIRVVKEHVASMGQAGKKKRKVKS